MPARRFIRAAALSCLIGLVINVVIAMWLGIRPVGASFGVHASVLPRDVAYSVSRQSTTGKAILTIRRTGPNPVSVPVLRESFVDRLPSGIAEPASGGYPASAAGQARILFPRWSAWAANGAAGEPRTVRAAGFPFPSLMTYEGQNAAGAPYSSGFLYQDTRDRWRFVPCIPILEGTIANSALFAAPPLAFFLVFPVVRKSLRLRRGHCPACNYDLRSDLPSGCPECGWNRSQGQPVPASTE